MGRYDMEIGPSLSDLMTQKAVQQAQIGAMGQESQLRNLQMQTAQRGAQDTEQLRALLPQLMQSGDPQGTLKSLMMSGNPQAMEMAGKMAPILTAMQKDNKTSWHDAGDKLIQLDTNGQPTGATMPKGAAPQQPEKLPWYVQKGQDGRPAGIDPLYREFELMKAQSGAAKTITPYYQFLPTADGYATGNARTGAITIPTVDGKRIVQSASDPALQGAIAGAKQTGEATAKRSFNMGGVGDIITQAENILKDTTDAPTSSVLGNVADKASGLVGYAPKGSVKADSLKVLGGYLVSKMPRMEGPQSNYDVQNYKEMAGDVGNSNLPIDRRVAALNTLKGIVSKYDTGTNQPSAPAGAKPQQPNANQVTLPNGAIKTFPNPLAAQAFKRAAGL